MVLPRSNQAPADVPEESQVAVRHTGLIQGTHSVRMRVGTGATPRQRTRVTPAPEFSIVTASPSPAFQCRARAGEEDRSRTQPEGRSTLPFDPGESATDLRLQTPSCLANRSARLYRMGSS